MKILYISSSVRSEQSLTNKLANEFIAKLQTRFPESVVVSRDLGDHPVKGPDLQWTQSNTIPDLDKSSHDWDVLAQSDALIEEIVSADRVVISAPMYNFSVPWTLKCYIDNIVRNERTFTIDPVEGFKPKLSADKKLVLITSSAGSYESGTPMEAYDFCTPYIRSVFGFMGLTDFHAVSAVNQWASEEMRNEAINEAHDALEALSASW
ncbi:hypothetical protein CWB89_20750 [Pseudoalteromonas piscicida]|uniref:FMN dependent NADH:quinone oxidoreductase n=1 Tax=Pseudoalteromonas piscicida TaxID=43662 RepID=A0AAQ2IQB0_PSEO7|nr:MULTISPECIES: NAD(P)H-dependent oxidoreductase [Pseudoalteromonas]KJY90170.1 hypothetical protein TW75_07830 [Pseudoalteromonas piscicida]MDP4489245.1 NAD(P)H-dependent oxidoreductase [Pseudoalteromonas piscicida]TMN36597.1 hypothetical protein CWB95_17155 [Pseudoalteromonas piscicida]TMN41535.1 hypothetical protein CWB94_07515 [Pseudoalteromonas piscicida]TMN49839.1 hypothetical protein CWB93_21485 [Pseudoalteromonas piscicida]|tara:strand:+ start:56 stop:679 length:624 start_codon:yes stop_codon:yes gene_type:complete